MIMPDPLPFYDTLLLPYISRSTTQVVPQLFDGEVTKGYTQPLLAISNEHMRRVQASAQKGQRGDQVCGQHVVEPQAAC